MSDEDREALAEALEAEEARPQREADPDAIVETGNWHRYAAALLPVVEAMARRRAAAELREAAHDLGRHFTVDGWLSGHGLTAVRSLTFRADDLEAE